MVELVDIWHDGATTATWQACSTMRTRPERWVDRVEELTDDELNAITDADPYWELIPEHGSYLWAIPKIPGPWSNGQTWKRCELKWWQTFRDPSALVAT